MGHSRPLDPDLAPGGVGPHRRRSTIFDLNVQNRDRSGPDLDRVPDPGWAIPAKPLKWGDLGPPKLTPILGPCLGVPFRLLAA